jgi:di/tricarboxylate transporter
VGRIFRFPQSQRRICAAQDELIGKTMQVGSAGDAELRKRDLRRVRIRQWASFSVTAVATAVGVSLHFQGADHQLTFGSALVILAVGFWALGALPEALTGLIFLVAVVIIGVSSPQVAFAGFTTTAFWLIFAGIILGLAVNRTGLAAWVAGHMLAFRDGLSGKDPAYGRVVALIVLLSAGLGLVLPSTIGRVALLVPLVLSLGQQLGFPKGSRGSAGLVLAAALATYVVPVTFLPANLPNMVLAGSLEALYGVTLTYGAYLFLHFPVLGMVKGIALAFLVTALFREDPRSVEGDENTVVEAPRLSPEAKRLAVILLLTLTLWASDVIHGVAAAWVGMAAAIICLLPFMRILPFEDFATKVQLPALIYIAAVLGLASVMMDSGVGAALGQWLIVMLPLAGASDAVVLGLTAALGVVTGLAATMPGAPAVAAPLFPQIAELTGWSVEAVGMTQVIAYATPLLPYQVPPLVVAIAIGGVRFADATRLMLLLAAVTTPIIAPLALLWWEILGWFPG